MKTLLYIIIAFLSIQIKAQTNLGINTDAPTTTVDVNGTMRVRNIATPQPYNSSDLLVWADGGILKTTDKTIDELSFIGLKTDSVEIIEKLKLMNLKNIFIVNDGYEFELED